MVAVEIQGGVLELTVCGFVQFFDNLGAVGFGVSEVGFEIFHEDGEALRGGVKMRGRGGAVLGAIDHEDGLAKAHLRAAGGIASVAVVLLEAEDAGEPGDGGVYIGVGDVGKEDVCGDGAIVEHEGMVAPVVGLRSR